MGKLTKNQKLALEKVEAGKAYSLKEAAQLVKDTTTTKFDASVDILVIDCTCSSRLLDESCSFLSITSII